MDPSANLREQRTLVARIIGMADAPDHALTIDQRASDGERLAELVQALDFWMKGGGFLPEGWRQPNEHDTRKQGTVR